MRQICGKCLYPIKTCICSNISEQQLMFDITILQHPKEAKNAKNTARLAKLVTPEISIVKTDDIESLKALRHCLVRESTVVLYPSKVSYPISTAILPTLSDTQQRMHLIVLDGTWRQAFQVWQTNDWLRGYDCYHFDNPDISNYKIRKSKDNTHLSTLEAISIFAQMVFNINPSKYLNAQKSLMDVWYRHSKK